MRLTRILKHIMDLPYNMVVCSLKLERGNVNNPEFLQSSESTNFHKDLATIYQIDQMPIFHP